MPKKVLLADDSITIQKVISITLSDEDVDLTVVGSGEEALSKGREIKPDLMLIDISLPDKDGYKVCEEIKKDPVLKDIPVLLLAGTFEPYNEEKGKEVGADDYIVKPFESQELISKVKALIEKKVSEAPEHPEFTGLEETKLSKEEEVASFSEMALFTEELEASQEAVKEKEEEWDLEGFLDIEEEALTEEAKEEKKEEEGLEDLLSEDILEEPLEEVFVPEEKKEPEELETLEEEELEEIEPLEEEEIEEMKVEVEEEKMEEAEEEKVEGLEVERFEGLEVEKLEEPEKEAESLEEEVEVEVPEGLGRGEVEHEVVKLEEEKMREAPEPSPSIPEVAEEVVKGVSPEAVKECIDAAVRDVVEEIAWEVLPDIIESIVREEIEKIKEALARGR